MSIAACQCPFYSICWRYSYSRYLLDVGYAIPPNRQELFLAGYATIEMMPKRGIFADSMPMIDGLPKNLCPCIESFEFDCFSQCPEYLKETKNRERLSARRQRQARYYNASDRLYIPQETRRKVAAQEKYTCVYCGRHNKQQWHGKPIRCVVDHVVPLALGGSPTAIENLTLSCQDCNRAKGTEIWTRGCRLGFYSDDPG